MLRLSLLLMVSGVQFVDVAKKAGLDFQHESGSVEKAALLETMSGGVAWLDYDSDGWLDLYFVNGGRLDDLKSGKRSVSNALFRNQGDGTFLNVTAAAGVEGTGWGMGVAAADFDNDGDTDLYICNFGRNTLYRNNGDGTFTDVSAASGADDPRWSSSAAWGDADGDGDLDLYVANYVAFDLAKHVGRSCAYRALKVHCGPRGLPGAADSFYRNNGDGTFTEATQESGLSADPSYALGAVWGDFDGDGDLDLYVANDSRANYLFQNRGRGSFEEVALLSGAAFSQDGNAQAGMGIAVADYDQDGLLDLFVTHFSDDYNTLYRNLGKGLFRDVSYGAGVAFSSRQLLGWGTQFFDHDNDGLLDLFVANGHVYPQVDDHQIGTSYLQPKLLYRNLGKGKFEDVTARSGDDLSRPTASRGAAFADFDKDGDVDIAVSNLGGRPQLLLNQGGSTSGNWISLKLEGTRSNRDASGARATLTAGGRRQMLEVQTGVGFQSSSELRLHFGIGSSKRAEKLRIRWPCGEVQEFQGVEGNRRYFLKEGGKLEAK